MDSFSSSTPSYSITIASLQLTEVCFLSLRRSALPEDASREEDIRCQAPAHSLLERTTGAPPGGFRQQPLLERGRPANPGGAAGTQRVADQDLVPEQTRKAEEGERPTERPRSQADCRRIVQSRELSGQVRCT